MTTRTLLRWLIASAASVWLTLAIAHEVPDPKFGGVVASTRHIDFELVSERDTVTLYVEDHGEPLLTEGARATLTVIDGPTRSEADLSPAAPNRLVGRVATVRAGVDAIATVTLPGPRVLTVRFKVK